MSRAPQLIREFRHLQHATEGRQRPPPVAAVEHDLTEIHQQIGRGPRTGHLDGGGQVLSSASDRPLAHRHPACLREDGHRLRITDDAGEGRMFGRLGRVSAGSHEQPQRGGMPPGLYRRGNLVVNDLPQQGVDELRPPGRGRAEHASARESLEDPIAFRR